MQCTVEIQEKNYSSTDIDIETIADSEEEL